MSPPEACGPGGPVGSVARFDPARPVDRGLLRAVLERASLAASPANLQPWRFLVIRSERNRRRLRACAFGDARLTDAPVAAVVLGYLHPHRSHLARVVAEAEARGALGPDEAARARVEVARTMERLADPAAWAARWGMVGAASLAAAAGTFGLGSALIDRHDPGRLRAEFGLPDDHAVACLAALGYPAGPEPFAGRLPLDELCYEEHFGQPWGPETP